MVFYTIVVLIDPADISITKQFVPVVMYILPILNTMVLVLIIHPANTGQGFVFPAFIEFTAEAARPQHVTLQRLWNTSLNFSFEYLLISICFVLSNLASFDQPETNMTIFISNIYSSDTQQLTQIINFSDWQKSIEVMGFTGGRTSQPQQITSKLPQSPPLWSKCHKVQRSLWSKSRFRFKFNLRQYIRTLHLESGLNMFLRLELARII